MKHYTLPLNDEAPGLEEPRIKYISRKAKGVYANILLDDPDRVLYRYSIYEDTDKELMTDSLHYIFLELPNCGRALTPEASILDNFCFSLHNMQFLEERPADLRQEIFELLFDAANIATFAPEDKIKYEYAMTTERDIRNQIRYAEKQGMEQGVLEVARRMLDGKMPIEKIVEFTGLTEEQIRAL